MTCNAEGREYDNCDLLIEGNRIKQIGSGIEATDDCYVINGRDLVALPGFVNCHHHMYQTLTRNIPRMQNQELFDWLINHYEVWRELDEQAVYYSTCLAMAELMLTGCTLSTDQLYLFPRGKKGLIDIQFEAAAQMGMRFLATRGSMSRSKSCGGLPPDDTVQDEDEILADSERLINTFHDASDDAMFRLALAPCSPFSITDDLMKRTAELARKYGVRIHTHLCETLDEEKYCQEVYGKRPLEVMEELNWMGPDVWFAHGIHFTDDEVARLASSGTKIAHCPVSNMRLSSGVAKVPLMIKLGVDVGLAVDGSASNDSSDMLGEVRQTVLLHRVNSGISSMDARTALRLGTQGGARTLGYEKAGVLEPGNLADIALFDLSHPGYAGSLSDPTAAIVFCGFDHTVHTLIVNGEVRVQNRQLLSVDLEEIRCMSNKISRRLIDLASRHTGINFFQQD